MNATDSRPAIQPRTVEEAVDAVRAHPRLFVIGAGTKTALSCPANNGVVLTSKGLTGIVGYEPGEFTFTAFAGTPVREIETALGRHGQYLPFAPPLADAGATIGGTVASGLSGPGRYRFGGVRDFILGVRFITGAGELVRGGGKVVKNAAGFDFPKLMVGSLGRLGAIVDVTFKVFPAPRDFVTVQFDFATLGAAVAAIERLGSSPFDIAALELAPPTRIWVRLCGFGETFAGRIRQLEQFIGASGEKREGPADRALWADLELRAPTASAFVIKVPVTPKVIPALDAKLAAIGAERRYGAGGQVAWITCRGGESEIDMLLRDEGLAGLDVFGVCRKPLLGTTRGTHFLARIKTALDPTNRFPAF